MTEIEQYKHTNSVQAGMLTEMRTQLDYTHKRMEMFEELLKSIREECRRPRKTVLAKLLDIYELTGRR